MHEVQRRKLYLIRSYGSLWEYVQKALGYSESQTSERISAMRLMFRIPDAKEALETGKVGLTQAAMTERHLRAREREDRTRVSRPEVKRLVRDISGKSRRETEKVLLTLRPKPERPEKIYDIQTDPRGYGAILGAQGQMLGGRDV